MKPINIDDFNKERYERKISIDICKEFKNNSEMYNKEHMLNHLVQSLTRNTTKEVDFNDVKCYIPDYLIDWDIKDGLLYKIGKINIDENFFSATKKC